MPYARSGDQPTCHCRGGQIRGFVRPRLLLQLSKEAAHGYELLEVLEARGLPTPDPSTLYRTLRQFEEEGLVRSTWETDGGGPARRVYELTDEGIEVLHAWAVSVRRTRNRLGEFLAEYEARFQIDGPEGADGRG